MISFFSNTVPYLLAGIVSYLIFRAVIWFFYYRGELRVPLWHEIGFAFLAFYILALFSSTITPALGFSLKPALGEAKFIPVTGIIGMVKDKSFLSVLGAVFRYLPLGLLVPFLFRRCRSYLKILLLGGGIACATELFQLFLTGADTSTDEVLLGMLGTFLGYFVFSAIRMYLPETARIGTVKRSRRKEVPFLVKKELEILLLVLLIAVAGQGARLETARVKEEKAAKEALEKKQEEERRAAEEEKARIQAEEEEKKLKTVENMPDLVLEAECACLFSIEDDMILYEKNAEERVIPASTTKLVTALTVLKYCSEDEVLTAGEEINLIEQGSSTASLKVGIRGSVRTFLCAMLLPSGNDAAYSLANYTGRKILGDENAQTADAVAAFVGAMNEMAAELELEDSNFADPAGSQLENQYTTARDMIRIARACVQNEIIMDLSGRKSSRALFENRDVTYQNTNLLLQPSSEYYYEGTIGLKTGSVNDEKCLVGALEIAGRRYITVVMRDSEEGRWKDTKILFDEAAGLN